MNNVMSVDHNIYYCFGFIVSWYVALINAITEQEITSKWKSNYQTIMKLIDF